MQAQLRSRWGDAVFAEGAVDRRAVAARVFSDEAELRWLESLMHPLVRESWQAAIDREPDAHWLVEIPLLFEKRLETLFDLTVCVSSPPDVVESDMVDGCTRFQAFRHVIIPVMWPGVITTGLFSFLLAYNDFAVTTLLLSKENQTMVPKIASFLGTTQTKGNVMFAVAAVVSVTAPLFVMIIFFQKQIVSGLTAGAVKG